VVRFHPTQHWLLQSVTCCTGAESAAPGISSPTHTTHILPTHHVVACADCDFSISVVPVSEQKGSRDAGKKDTKKDGKAAAKTATATVSTQQVRFHANAAQVLDDSLIVEWHCNSHSFVETCAHSVRVRRP